MRKYLRTGLLIPSMAALAIASNVTAAVAATTTTWTVTPGGKFGSGDMMRFSLTDTSTGAKICGNSWSAAGTFKTGTGLANPLGKITSVNIACSEGGLPLLVTFSVIDFRATRYDASQDLVYGAFTHIHATASGTKGSACTATLDGTAPSADNGQLNFRYYNQSSGSASDELVTKPQDSNLHFYDVSGCGDAINDGDAVAIRVVSNFDSDVAGHTDQPITITSP